MSSSSQMFEKFGQYILVKKLATGGMAEIFLALRGDKTGGVTQFVVIKRILPHLSTSKRFKTMFKNEGKITSNLRHSNMVSIYEFGCTNNSYYIVMEYISGCCLKDLMNKITKQKIRLSMPSIISIIRSLASVLHYTHTSIDQKTGLPLGLIHRDVSPHNVMVGFNGDIKLIDFGVAKETDHDMTGTGVVKGKFSYMSPEQIQGEKLDYRTDIFSLGLVFWEILTGHKLFSGKTITEIIEKIKKCQIYDISGIRPDLPKGLLNILYNCLQKDRKKRYQSAEKLERDLNLILNKEYPNFSTFDFQTVVKNLYKEEILAERKYFVNILKKIPEHLSFKDSWSGTFFDIDPVVDGGKYKIEKEATELTMPYLVNKNGSTDKQSEQNPALNMKTMPRAEEKINKEDPQKESAEKESTDSLEGEPTILSPRAPIHHSRTNIASDTIVARAEECEVTNHEKRETKVTSWSDLIQKATYHQKNRKRSKFLGLFLMVPVLIAAFYMIFGKQIPEVNIQGLDVISVPNSSGQSSFDPLPNDLEKGEDIFYKNKRSLASDEEPQVEKKPVKKPIRKTASIEKGGTIKVFVATNPSGGEIYLNKKKLNVKTPALISFPFDPNNKLTIKKSGYESYVASGLFRSQEIDVRLKKIDKQKF